MPLEKYFMKTIKWLRDFDPESEEVMLPKVQQVPVCIPDFNWDSPNLHETFKHFGE